MTKKSALNDPIFNDENAAREWLEKRLWPDGPICPHCGVVDEATLLKGKSHRPGLYQCNACRKPFTVTVGTLYERSKIPLTKWLAATYLLKSSKKGISALQIHRTLHVSKKTAWFLMHRIREADRNPGGKKKPPMGSGGGAVEVDETFYGRAPNPTGVKGIHAMNKVLSLVDRTTGEARSFVIAELSMGEITPILTANIAREARIMTDEAAYYRHLGHVFAEHGSVVHHADEWARGDISTNAVEGFYSIMKRGLRGIYQCVSAQHLHRYVAEFDARYTYREATGFDDRARFEQGIPGIVGKRLTYRRTRRSKEAEAHAEH
jgi:transposase-like protein